MKFEITRNVLGSSTILPIALTEFEQIRDARDALFSLLQVELDYDILVGNWLQLEAAAMSLSLESYARHNWTRTQTDRNHTELNRHVSNLLSSARSFIDHTTKSLPALPGSAADDEQKVRTLFSTQYDTRLSYRVIEALRNYTQHRGLPTQGLGSQMRWEGDGDEARLMASVNVHLRLDELRTDPKFKKSVLCELESAKGNVVDVLPLLREYVAGLSHVLQQIRELYHDKELVWSGTLEDWINGYLQVAPDAKGRDVGIIALQLDDDGDTLQEIALSVQFKERIASFRSRNRKLVNVHKLQVTM